MKDLFLTNGTNETFLDHIKQSFKKCISFKLTVSFIKNAGLILLEREIEEALEHGANGQIITTSYQNFTDIASLNKFKYWMDKYPNFKCHFDFKCFGDDGFHSKGYIFEYDDSFELIVGSTNITRFALLKNIEWNVSLLDKSRCNSYINALEEFDHLWNKTYVLNESIIKEYKIQQDYAIDRWDMDYCDLNNIPIVPNAMQRRALKEIRRYRDMGEKKALVISATGSGKTYLAAFDVKNFDAKRLLFVVHRDSILVDAKKTFEKVFGASRSYGLYTGKQQDLDRDFIFASNQMISRHLNEFDKNEFDYICLDEAHHATASTYEKIMNHFNAEFVLGLTATPERMDDKDVFELFGKNIPYELRLYDAITNDLVVPFHYYGIRDRLVDYSIDDKSKIAKEISKIENIDFIDNEIKKHLVEIHGKLKCIAFCSSVSHAQLMAEEFWEVGYNAIALTGTNDLGQRIKAFSDLQDDSNPLEIICTVDILNEGVDIPAVNMILFLRPTESSTIFLQQLGRGLRKYPNKDYVVVLDFIGNNYDRSVQIALALGSISDNKTIEKKYIKDMIATDFITIKESGIIIDIDELSKEEIIKYLDSTNFNRLDFLKKDYLNFKKYLRCDNFPTHMDFLNCEFSPDILRFMKSSVRGGKNFSYYSFLKKIEEENIPTFNDQEIELINSISELLPIVRVDEYLIMKQLLETGYIDLNLLVNFNSKVTQSTLEHALNNLIRSKILIDDKFLVNSVNDELKTYLNDLLTYGLTRYEIEFGEHDGLFKLYGNYYKSQIMNILLEPSSMYMKGTKFGDEGITYLFVGLKKDKEKQERTNYKDKFISTKVFQWESENNTRFDNTIGKKLLNTKTVHLFVRKMDSEDGITLPFTYFGTGTFTNVRKSFVKRISKNKIEDVDTLLFDIILENEVDEKYKLDFEIPESIEGVN